VVKDKTDRTPIEEALYQATKAYEFAPSSYTHGALTAIRQVWAMLRCAEPDANAQALPEEPVRPARWGMRP
jgi:hypothetical protein